MTPGYYQNLGARPLLTAEEEVELSTAISLGRAARERIEQGRERPGDVALAGDGRRARDELVLANLRLVVHIARGYHRWWTVELDDLVQAGNAGLQRAADGFDGTRGFRFSTYATRWIHQSVGRWLDRSAPGGHIPAERCQQHRAARRFAEDGAEGGAAIAAGVFQPLSLSATRTDGSPLTNVLSVDEQDVAVEVQRQLRHDAVIRHVRSLPVEQRAVVALRFGLADGVAASYAEIGSRLGVEPHRVGRIVKDALNALRVALAEDPAG